MLIRNVATLLKARYDITGNLEDLEKKWCRFCNRVLKYTTKNLKRLMRAPPLFAKGRTEDVERSNRNPRKKSIKLTKTKFFLF